MFLKESTWDSHVRLEKRLAVKDRFSNIDLYSARLSQLLDFHAGAEKLWGGLLQRVLDDYPARLKAPLLKRDIEALGGVLPESCALQRSWPRIPAAADPAAALGGFYVLEGATLGGRHLLPIVERKLALSASQGACHLASYGSEVLPMWRKFRATIEAECATPQTRDRAGAMARDTFLALETWLCGEMS
jgi:heme oxygenase